MTFLVKKGLLTGLITVACLSVFSQAEIQNTGASGFWKTKGNLGNNSVNNFVGNIDRVNLPFRTDNVQRMVIDTFGRVGIQTPTPLAPLDVAQTNGSSNFTILTTNYGNPNDVILSRAQGTIGAPTLIGSGGTGIYSRLIARGYDGTGFRTAAQIAFEVDAATGANDMPGRITFWTTPDGTTTAVERIRIEQTGEVGIGETNPLRLLHVGGLTNTIRVTGLSTGGSFITTPAATTDKLLYADANGDIRAMTAGTTGQVLTYTATGPAWAAAGSGSGSSWNLTGNTGITSPAVPVTYGTSTIGVSENWIGTTDANDVVLGTNTIERMRILRNTGFVGIGLSAPLARLDVADVSNAAIRVTSTNSGNPSVEFFRPGNPSIDWRIINQGGSLEIARSSTDLATATNLYRFGANSFIPLTDNAISCGINGNAWLNVQSYAFTTSSDSRLKKDIAPLHYGLQTLLHLSPVSYKWIEKPYLGKRLGFIAQDVQKVMPEVVQSSTIEVDPETGEKKEVPTKYLSVNYIDIIPVVVKGVQEQQEMIDSLQKENRELKQRLQRLEKLLEKKE